MTIPIYVVGSSNTDMVVKAERLPMPGETVLGGTFFMNAGGKGANQAVAAARLGGNVLLVAHVGNDLFGEQAVTHFQKEKINTSFVTRNPEYPSGVALIVVDSKGENCISVAPGSNRHLLPMHIGAAFKGLSAPAFVLIQMEIPDATIAFTLEYCRKNNLKAILNPAPAKALDKHILQGLYLITPNESEAEILTGIRVIDEVSACKAAEQLRAMGIANVVVTLGSKGALLMTGEEMKHILSPKVTSVDSTAAGDCFNGALAVALSEGRPLADAVAFACRAASISVTRLGAQASMPFRNEMQ